MRRTTLPLRQTTNHMIQYAHRSGQFFATSLTEKCEGMLEGAIGIHAFRNGQLYSGMSIPMEQGGHVPPNIYEGGDIHDNVPPLF